jgi:hypothetical protein
VLAIRRFAPTGSAQMQFMGLALISDSDYNWATYFMNSSNHIPGVPLDWISFHFYAQPRDRSGGDTGAAYEEMFDEADAKFFPNAAQFIQIRDSINPSVKLDANELGVILPDDNNPKWTDSDPGFPLIYWNAAAALYAYEYGVLSVLGLDVVGMSQLVGYPSLNVTRSDTGDTVQLFPQYPSVAMLNWTTGAGTARYWTLKLLIDTLQPQVDVVVPSSTSAAGVYAQGYMDPTSNQQKVLLLNKKHTAQQVQLPKGMEGATTRCVDEATEFGPAREGTLPDSGVLTLAPFAVCMVLTTVVA